MASNLGYSEVWGFFYPYLRYPQAVLIQDIKQAMNRSLKMKPPFGFYIRISVK